MENWLRSAWVLCSQRDSNAAVEEPMHGSGANRRALRTLHQSSYSLECAVQKTVQGDFHCL